MLAVGALDGNVASPSAYSISSMSSTVPAGYTPTAVRQAHGFDQVAFENGAIAGVGNGQTSGGSTTPDVSHADDLHAAAADLDLAGSSNGASVGHDTAPATGLGSRVANTVVNGLVAQASTAAPASAAATRNSTTTSTTTQPGSSGLLATHSTPADVALLAAAFTAANLPTQPVNPVSVAAPFTGTAAGAAVPTTPPAP
ncbi:MAG TPA: hypothetical protein VGX76_14070, partial [Pirellulales bacterium]|nr:hypothetical protein [Pirellulales bacterium]